MSSEKKGVTEKNQYLKKYIIYKQNMIEIKIKN